MGIVSKLRGGDQRTIEDYDDQYLEFTGGDVETASSAQMAVHIAEINEQQDIIPIKDAVYDGHIVIADITHHRTSGSTIEHFIDELRQVVKETGGDIVQKGDDELIVTPAGVGISREKLTQ